MPLVDYEEQRLFLKLDPGTDEALLGDLLDQATKLFERQCHRGEVPFKKGEVNRVEILEAQPGSTELWLDYPVKAITSVALGRDVNNPDETLNPADATQLVWRVGKRQITRTDGGLWEAGSPLLNFSRGMGWGSSSSAPKGPSWIKVVYDTVHDLPADAKLAVQRMVAAIYRQRGIEGTSNNAKDGVSESTTAGFTMFASTDDTWKLAVEAHRRLIAR